MGNFDSYGTDYWVLLTRWPRTVQASLSRTGDDTSVSPPFTTYHSPQNHIGRPIEKYFHLSAPNLSQFPLTPHSKAEVFKATFSPLLKNLRAAPFATLSTLISPKTVVSRARNISRTQLAQSGVIVAEVIGFFTIGEIIGRRKLVGYRSNN